MKDELFEDLLESVQEGGTILGGEAKPARRVEIEAPDVAEIRSSYGMSQEEFRDVARDQRPDTAELGAGAPLPHGRLASSCG